MALSSNTQKIIKIVVRSRRSFNDVFILFAANLSKGEDFVSVEFESTEVPPDIGYQKQYEISYTFTDLIIGENVLAIKLIGQDSIERTSYYTVIREFPHEEITVTSLSDFLPILSNLIPAHNVTNVDRVTSLQWTVFDPESNPVLFDVFFGKSETPNLVSANQSTPVYPPTVSLKLDAGNTYAWKIIAKELIPPGFTSVGGITESSTLIFRVAYAPDIPNSPFPIHNSIEVDPTNVTLSWETQSQDGNPLTYDIYFGPTSNPPKLGPLSVPPIPFPPISTKYFNVGALTPNTTYYWKIVVSDNKSNTVPGPKWKFKTGA